MRTIELSIPMIMALLMAGCSGDQGVSAPQLPPAPPLQSVPTTRQIMLGMVAPTSDAVFGSAAEPPTGAAGWERVEASAAVLAVSAELLKLPAAAVDRGEWVKYCDALVAAAKATSQAAKQHDAQQVSGLGNQIYETCEGCHMKYFAGRTGAQ